MISQELFDLVVKLLEEKIDRLTQELASCRDEIQRLRQQRDDDREADGSKS